VTESESICVVVDGLGIALVLDALVSRILEHVGFIQYGLESLHVVGFDVWLRVLFLFFLHEGFICDD
jgi:hypothetical protein